MMMKRFGWIFVKETVKVVKEMDVKILSPPKKMYVCFFFKEKIVVKTGW